MVIKRPKPEKIVVKLQEEGTLSLSEFCTDVVFTRQAVSKHLRTLTAANLVSYENTGRETHFRLEIERLEIANQFLNDVALKWDVSAAEKKSQSQLNLRVTIPESCHSSVVQHRSKRALSTPSPQSARRSAMPVFMVLGQYRDVKVRVI